MDHTASEFSAGDCKRELLAHDPEPPSLRTREFQTRSVQPTNEDNVQPPKMSSNHSTMSHGNHGQHAANSYFSSSHQIDYSEVYPSAPFALPTTWPEPYLTYHNLSAPSNHDATTSYSTHQEPYFGIYDQSIHHEYGTSSAPLNLTTSPEFLVDTGYTLEPPANWEDEIFNPGPTSHTTGSIDSFGLGASADWMNSHNAFADQASIPAPSQLQLVGHFPQAMVAPQPSGQALTCPHGCVRTFGRPGEYRRHMKKHGPRNIHCTQLGCFMSFYRQDKLRDHLRQAHNIVTLTSGRAATGRRRG